MSRHTFEDKAGDNYSAEVVPDIPSLIDIWMGEESYDTNLITIRVDAAEDLARIILAAAKEAQA